MALHSMQQGHLSGISIPMLHQLFRMNQAIKRRPLLFGSVFASGQGMLADYTIQRYVENKSGINLKRTAAFGLFGFGHVGIIQYGIYCKLYPALFSKMHHHIRVPMQMACDAFFHCAFLYYPIFYTFRGALCKEPDVKTGHAVQESLERYWNLTFWEDITNSATIWIPANVVTFGLLPLHLRIPWTKCIALGNQMRLSCQRGCLEC